MSIFSSKGGRWWSVVVLGLVAVLVITGIVLTTVFRDSASEDAKYAYVGREQCMDCHQEATSDWTGSHHDLAMQKATGETVLGNFQDTTFIHAGDTTRFFRRDSTFYVETPGPDGTQQQYPVRYTFGVEPLQQYLIPFPGGRLQALNIAWDVNRKDWYHLYPEESFGRNDPLHWTGRLHTWNSMCASCHSTNLQKNYDPEQHTYNTTWSEIDVSCESCHGPGSEHVEWARSASESDSGEDYGKSAGFRVDLDAQDPDVEIETCARCHSRRQKISFDYEHGENFLNHFTPELLRENLYYPDGQIKDEVFVYGSFLQSKMYRRGVRCTDCHNPHSVELKREGNALCTSCHAPDTFDTPEHHFHPEETAGSQCVNCHMPGKKYMQIDFRRDHSIRIPRPDLSQELGTPNACNRCHTDRSNEWAADAFAQWWGVPDTTHYGEIFAKARAGDPGVQSELIDLATDTISSKIVQATSLYLLRRYSGRSATQVLQDMTGSPEPLKRYAAVGGLERLDPVARKAVVQPVTDDSIRAPRIEAGRVLAAVPDVQFTDAELRQRDQAIEDYIKSHMVTAERPSSRLNLGVLYENLGQTKKAVQAYRAAIRLDSSYVGAMVNLAMLQNRQGNQARAEDLLRRVVQVQPEMGQAQYMLGLLLAGQTNRLPEAADHLGKAATILPDSARVHYNYGLALQRLGRRDEAEEQLQQAHKLKPQSADFLYALVVLYAQDQRWEQAYKYAQRLVKIEPQSRQYQGLLKQIRDSLDQ